MGCAPQSDNWTQTDTRTSWITNRGYTGHEHLAPFGGVGGGCIINMNGRVYDPLTAQFLSPDPFIQAPDNWLNYNRYSYCFNNPLSYTDPSGYRLREAEDCPAYWSPQIDPQQMWDNLQGYRDGAWGSGGHGSGSSGSGAGYGYHYNWSDGFYYNHNGIEVSYDDVFNNYILPNASYYSAGNNAALFLTGYGYRPYGEPSIDMSGIENNIKSLIAGLEKNTTNAWNNLVNNISSINPLTEIWNSLIVRMYIKDVYQIGVSSDISAFIGFGVQPINFSLITRGKEPGIYFTPTLSGSLGTGISADAVITFSTGFYTGDPENIQSSDIKGSAIGVSGALGVGPDVSINGSYSFAGNGKGFINIGGQFGLGI